MRLAGFGGLATAALRQMAHPATKAKMAQRIVRSAAEGVTDAQTLMAVAVEKGKEPAL